MYMTKPKQVQKKLSENTGKTFSVIMPSFTCRGWAYLRKLLYREVLMMIVVSTYRKLGTAPPISVTQKSQAEKYKVFFSGLQKKRTLFCTTLLVDVTKIVLLWQLLDQQKLCQLFLLALKRGRLIFSHLFKGVTWMSIREKGNPLVAH